MELLSELSLVDSESRWMDKAACKGMDFNTFFPKIGHSDLAKMARTVCESCPVQVRCLEFANNNNIMYGIWGGLSVLERKRTGRIKQRWT